MQHFQFLTGQFFFAGLVEHKSVFQLVQAGATLPLGYVDK